MLRLLGIFGAKIIPLITFTYRFDFYPWIVFKIKIQFFEIQFHEWSVIYRWVIYRNTAGNTNIKKNSGGSCEKKRCQYIFCIFVEFPRCYYVHLQEFRQPRLTRWQIHELVLCTTQTNIATCSFGLRMRTKCTLGL